MGTEADSRALLAAINQLGATLDWAEERLYAVADASAWSPAQHVQHTLIALRRCFAAVEQLRAGEGGEAVKPKGGPSLSGRALLLSGWIPRGKADAPDFAVPDAIPSRAALRESHAAASERFAALAKVAARMREVPGVIDHQVLGAFTAVNWWRFGRIHTEHHLAIIDDIDRHRVAANPLEDTSTGPIGEVP